MPLTLLAPVDKNERIFLSMYAAVLYCAESFFSNSINQTIMKKTSLKMNWHSIATFFLLSIVILSGCKKTDIPRNNGPQASFYSSDVLDKWMTMQLRLMTNATGIPNQAFSRHYAYAGIAAVESIAPGVHAHNAWSKKWNGLTGLPEADHKKNYYYPANINSAMASINRSFFPNASSADKQAIDSLENALTQEFLATKPASLVQTSAQFGKDVAAAVFNWSETDGSKLAGSPYTPPTGPGLWVPTPPAFGNAASPYWGNNRPVIRGSIDNTELPAPIAYSPEVGSPFYQMVKHVYDASQNLTDAQKAMAIFWRDVPGVTSPGHWLSIVQQAARQANASLEKAAAAYAITGSAINDALITCWKAKYKYNLVRPITFIRNVLGYTTWNSHLTTPGHPEYPSAHAVLSIAAGEAMQRLFGNVGSFTDHTYDYLGFAPRTYSSFVAIGEEAGDSRFYAGIHYQQSIEAGFIQGKKVAANIFSGGQE